MEHEAETKGSVNRYTGSTDVFFLGRVTWAGAGLACVHAFGPQGLLTGNQTPFTGRPGHATGAD